MKDEGFSGDLGDETAEDQLGDLVSSGSVGKVRFFSEKKGWGFVVPEGGGEDIFFHYSEIMVEGFKYLPPDTPVSYELWHDPNRRLNGLIARKVTPKYN